MTDNTGWITASNQNGTCIDVRRQGDVVQIRESAEPDLTITTTPVRFAKFIQGVKAGLFDGLAAP